MSGLPAAELHQPGFNLHADQGDRILGTMVALIALASTFVVLRLTSRHLARAGFWWDDVLMVIALLLATVPCICNIVAVKHVGFGKHIFVFGKQGAAEAATGYFHVLYFFQLFFTLATGATKLAVLAFYRRIFPIAELKLILIIMTTVVVMYTTAVSTLIIFQCHPIRKFWEFEQPGHCLSGLEDLIVSGSVNTVLDFTIVCLVKAFQPPALSFLISHQARTSTMASADFYTAEEYLDRYLSYSWIVSQNTQFESCTRSTAYEGDSVCIVSIIRIITFTRVDPADITWNFVGVAIWSAVEPIVGIFGAVSTPVSLFSLKDECRNPQVSSLSAADTERRQCLPSLRPLISHLLDNNAYRSFVASTSQTFQSSISSSSVLKSNQSKSRNRDSTSFARLEEHDGNANTQRLPWRDQKGPRVYDNEPDGRIITVYGGRGPPGRDENDAVEMDRLSDAEPPKGVIRVKTEILLSTSKRLDYNNRLY
ncbi:MAG: hypothetical protein ASARMPRED_007807 [Alectoria sarmentosa]|nr:MAG: hypothetical protein ASARMPRED_007807 [Alectoria sarmentosa]